MATNAARRSARHTNASPASSKPEPTRSSPTDADAGHSQGSGSGNGSSAPTGTALIAAPALFDPVGFGTLPAIPLVPAALLRRHHAFVPTDTRYRSAARLLACLWARDRGLEPGRYRDGTGRTRKLGSRITAAAGRRGGNFVHPLLARLAEREMIYCEVGSVWEPERVRCNLLSSTTMALNVFGPLKLDPALATAVVAQLAPGFMVEVTDIRFENSPARGSSDYTRDATAWDVVIRGRTPTGQRAAIFIETKLTEGTDARPSFSGQFDAIAARSGLFVDPADPALRAAPVQQLFRQACLADAALHHGLYDTAQHWLVAPRDNHLAQNAGTAYARHLKDPSGGRQPFRAITLETLLDAIGAAGAPDLARVLFGRYLNVARLADVIDLDAGLTSANDDAPFGRDAAHGGFDVGSFASHPAG